MANGRYFLDLDLERPYNHMVDQIVDALSFEVTRVPAAHARVLQSGWGAGSVELAVQMVRGTAPIASNALTAPTA
jgi:hypothetical protein